MLDDFFYLQSDEQEYNMWEFNDIEFINKLINLQDENLLHKLLRTFCEANNLVRQADKLNDINLYNAAYKLYREVKCFLK